MRGEFQPDDPDERTLSPQPRPNVLIEAGHGDGALSRAHCSRAGGLEPPVFSDIAGIHSIKIDNTLEKRRDLARRLKLTGCEIVDLASNIDWQVAGNFTLDLSKATAF